MFSVSPGTPGRREQMPRTKSSTRTPAREQLNAILDALRADREKGWLMQPDGTYIREDGGEGSSSQEALYRYFSSRKVSLRENSPASENKKEESVSSAPPETGLRAFLRRLFHA